MLLPVRQIQTELLGALESSNRLVLIAPTGSGKTTQVPQMLLDAGIAGDKRIVILQPRRVAARTVAARVAWERSCPLGAEVGYQIRFDDHTSLGTRICFVTEGILLRWLQDDRNLSSIGAILFDEFHERNLLSDVALALVKRIQESSRPDLVLLVMSATLDAQPVATYLGNCPVLISEGQSYAVELRFLDLPDERPPADQAADAVAQILQQGETGDILIFMPGMGEINATLQSLRARRLGEPLALIPLHGDLPPNEQDLAFRPNNHRKVVIATNVAETSITIDGIRHVVDSGLARIARFDAERGIGTLSIEPISRASADQRKGRAGRTAPGTCHRLWTESNHLNRADCNTPEIQRSDLAEVVLLLHSLHIRKAAEFDWLDKPNPAAVERAEKLLRMLGALQSVSSTHADATDLTPVGRQMLQLPMHPRYSRMLVEAALRECVPEAALCAALVSGRDLLVRLRREENHINQLREDLFETSDESDFFTLIRAFHFARENRFDLERCKRHGIHSQTARMIDQTHRQILQAARRLFTAAPEPESTTNADDAIRDARQPLLRCLTAGFIDQLCLRRDTGTLECSMTEGRAGTLMRESVVRDAPFFVAASLREVPSRGSSSVTLLGLASATKLEWIQEMFPQHLTRETVHAYDETHKRVAAIEVLRFRDLIIAQQHQNQVDPGAAGRALAEAHLRSLFALPLFTHEIKQFIARVNLAAVTLPELEIPPFSEQVVLQCLSKAFHGLTLAKQAQTIPLDRAFRTHLPSDLMSWIDELAPVSIPWPGGRKVKLLYSEQPTGKSGKSNPPELQIKLHECFQLNRHPTVCEGKLPVKLWLSTPNGKRLDSTEDWPAFKAKTYPQLKSTLQKKFPGVGWL